MTTHRVLPFFGSGSSSGVASRGVYGVRCRLDVDLGLGDVEVGAHEPVGLGRARADEGLPEHQRAPDEAVAVAAPRGGCPVGDVEHLGHGQDLNVLPAGTGREPEERVALDQAGAARVAEHRADASDRPAHLADIEPLQGQLDDDIAQQHLAVLVDETA